MRTNIITYHHYFCEGPPVYTPVENVFMKKGQKQVKKKAFKIIANIEDVGLNED